MQVSKINPFPFLSPTPSRTTISFRFRIPCLLPTVSPPYKAPMHPSTPRFASDQPLTSLTLSMAVLRERRPNLTLKLPSPEEPSFLAGDCRLRPPLPPLPAAPTIAGVSASLAGEYRLSDFDKLRILGRGNDGRVYQVRHRRSGGVFALKELSPDAVTRRGAIREEEILLCAGDSPAVVRCHAAFPTPSSEVALLLEYVDGGSLDAVLRRRGPFPEPALAAVAAQALTGLAHLRSRCIVHRDIKPANLLTTSGGEVKIADFGVGKILQRQLDRCASYVGTCAYMSPERFDPEAYGGDYDPYAADVWSLGLAVLELGLGRYPLLPEGQRPDWAGLMYAICFSDSPATLPEGATPEFGDFVGRCLEKDPARRVSVSELLAHPFVAGRDRVESDRALRELVRLNDESEDPEPAPES